MSSGHDAFCFATRDRRIATLSVAAAEYGDGNSGSSSNNTTTPKPTTPEFCPRLAVLLLLRCRSSSTDGRPSSRTTTTTWQYYYGWTLMTTTFEQEDADRPGHESAISVAHQHSHVGFRNRPTWQLDCPTLDDP